MTPPQTSPTWPLATPYRGSPVPLESTLEAEFSATQLRELAKWLEVKLKGTSKSGYIEQVSEALKSRSEGVDGSHSDGHHQNGEAILAGLNDEQADFMRCMLTARDADAPLPRSVAMTAWARQFGPEAPRKLAEVIENLRRRALLFPTITYFTNSFRDVYYQWLPLGKNTPVLKWRVTNDERRINSTFATRHSSFLDGFEIFLNAVIQSGLALRPALKPHPKTKQIYWLQGWEHDADEADRVLNSRPNWVPDPTTGLSVPMLSPFTAEGANLIETQTGLSLPQCELFMAIGCALQLIAQPDKSGYASANMHAVEEWFGLSAEDKLGRAWLAWSEQMMAGVELRNAMSSVRVSETFQVMRAIGARSLTPGQMAAEWCSLRRYMARVLRGLPVGVWVDWDALRAQLFAFYPDCAWASAGRSEWWFATGGGRIKTDPLQAPDWNGTIGVILECILRDALAWFGAIEVTVSEANRLQAFRITEIGEWLIGSRSNTLPEAAKPKQRAAEPIRWLDEHTLRLPPAPSGPSSPALCGRWPSAAARRLPLRSQRPRLSVHWRKALAQTQWRSNLRRLS